MANFAFAMAASRWNRISSGSPGSPNFGRRLGRCVGCFRCATGSENDRSFMPLRRSSDRGRCAAEDSDAVHVLDLSPLWCAVGVSNSENSACSFGSGFRNTIYLGRQAHRVLSLQQLWLHDALRERREAVEQSHRRQCAHDVTSRYLRTEGENL